MVIEQSLHHYKGMVFWSDSDSAYIAVAPDLPGCCAIGDTKEEAAISLDFAISAWVAAMKFEDGFVPAECRLN